MNLFFFFEIIYLFCILIFCIFGLHYIYITYLFLKHKKKIANDKQFIRQFYQSHSLNDFPKVLTQIPVFNEKFVVKRIIDKVTQINYPKKKHEIQILDDSTDETKEIIEKIVAKYQKIGFLITHVHREKRIDFKAGALQNGLLLSKADFIAIFDADFLPPKNFLKHTIPHFIKNKKVGMVQTRWGYINRKTNQITSTQSIGIDGHFVIEQSARHWNKLFFGFNGTAGIWKKQAILEAGGWQADTLTEDLDLSYRSQLKGWKMVYLPYIVCPSEIPENINSYKTQQYRWAKGSIQTAKKLLLPIWKSPIKIKQKIESSFHLLHYGINLIILISVLISVPLGIIFHKNKTHLIKEEFIPLIIFICVGSFLSPMLMYTCSQIALFRKNWLREIRLIPALVLLGLGSAANNSIAVISALLTNPRKNHFIRTPKTGFSVKTTKKTKKKLLYKSSKNSLIMLFELSLSVYTILAFLLFFSKNEWGLVSLSFIYFLSFTYFFIISLKHQNSF